MKMVQRLILAAALMTGLAPVMAQVPPAVPGLPDAERRISYTIAGTTCACSLGANLALYGDSNDYQDWVEVFINGVQVTYNDPVFGWTITSPTGPLATIPRPITDGVLTFNSVQTGTIQIVGARRPRRVSQFNENTGVPARNLNQALTDVVAMLREDWDKINDVTGRGVFAPPGETMKTLPPAAQRASMNVAFDSGGNLVPVASVGSTTFAAGNGITFTGTNPTTITNNIAASAPIVITGTNPKTISCPTCVIASAAPPIFASRAAAAAQNLSALTAITTLGYATPGDGGKADFVNIGTASFLDSTPTFTLTNAGTGCTSATFSQYLSVPSNPRANGTIGRFTVSGGTITSWTIPVPGAGYNVGDTVTFASGFITGCATLPVWTVSSVTTPTGSFTDTAGDRWQIQLRPDSGISILAFGAKNDWTVTAGDAGSTNNTTAIQNAVWFAYGQGQNIASGQLTATGAIVNLPPKTTMACALNLPYGVTLQGAGRYSSVLKDCDAEPAANNFITVGDPNLQLSCFGSLLRDLSIAPGTQTNAPSAGTAIVFSNCIQQMTFMDRIDIGAGVRSCISLQTGFGGAEGIGMHEIECGMAAGSTNPGISLNYGSAKIDLNHIEIEAGAHVSTVAGMQIVSGNVDARNIDIENIDSGIVVNTAANGGISSFHHVGGTTCINLITRQNTSPANVNIVGMSAGCTNTLNNGGTPTTGNIIADAVF